MTRRINPKPWVTVDDRPLMPFSARVSCRLNGSLQLSDLSLVWWSPSLRTRGMTLVEGQVTVHIIHDSAPGSAFALVGRLAQMMGSGGASGPQDSIAFGIPGLPGKQYVGPGAYSFSSLQGGSTQTNATLANAARFELWSLGRPAGRVLRLQIEGAISAGMTY